MLMQAFCNTCSDFCIEKTEVTYDTSYYSRLDFYLELFLVGS